MFKTTAKAQGVGEVVVVNLDSLQAHAFNVTEIESQENLNITTRNAYEVPVPQDAIAALSELHNVKQSFEDVENRAGK